MRREIRDLSDEDRNRVLDAMEVMYRTDIEEGRGLYGKDFKSSGELAALHSATSKYCFHWGDQFITSHPSFQVTRGGAAKRCPPQERKGCSASRLAHLTTPPP